MSLADAGGVLLNGAVKQSTNHNNYKDANVVERKPLAVCATKLFGYPVK